MSVTLCLDTTSNRLMLGLMRAGGLAAEFSEECHSHRQHSAMLIPAIEDLLKQTGLAVGDIEALAVNHGPGSFTGIRTGVVTARTMAQFLNCPVYVFNTFELLTAGREGPVAVYLDALRGRAYHAVLQWKPDGADYLCPPRLTHLTPEANPAEAGCRLLVSPSLVNAFAPGMAEGITGEKNSCAAMVALINQYGNTFRKSWQDTKPLYLQDPSITPPKSPSTGN